MSEEKDLLPLLGGYDEVRNCGRAFTDVDLFLPSPWFGKDGALNFFLSQNIKPGRDIALGTDQQSLQIAGLVRIGIANLRIFGDGKAGKMGLRPTT
jgi:hypothetical protein